MRYKRWVDHAPSRADRDRAIHGLVLLVPALLLGLLVGTQWQSQGSRTVTASRYRVPLADATYELQQEQARLKGEAADMRARLDAIQGQAAALSGEGLSLEADIARLRTAAGLSPRSGPGVVVTLDDGRIPATAPRQNIELAIVHSSDITDVLNVGWRAGAEAISVNGERITASSACVGAVIQINGTLLSPPFVVNIVGPVDALLRSFGDPSELRDVKKRREAFGLGFQVARPAAVDVPAYSGPLVARYAIPY